MSKNWSFLKALPFNSKILKHIFINIAFCCSVSFSYAQILQGTVYDSKTREALPGVVIFLDGTSIITTSDNNGKFLLVVENKINVNLVFRHLSYESLVIEKPFEHYGEAFFLKEKTNLIREAVVAADYDPFTRAERIKVFKEFFLGTSVAAKSCVILNEDDIMIYYDNNTEILHAFARNPLIVENQYLGYRITIDIKYFQVEFTYSKSVSQSSSAIGSSITVVQPNSFVAVPSSFSYRINSFFEDISPYSFAFINRRNQIYERSREYFWLSFINNSLIKSGFKIYNKSKEIMCPEDYFVVIDNPIQRTMVVLIKPDTDINRKQNEVLEGNIYGVIGIRVKNKIDSEVIFLTNRFSVDLFGNITTNGLIYQGNMAQQRIGDMLPRDFIYTPSKASQRRR